MKKGYSTMTGFTPDAPVLHEIKNHSEALAQAEAGVAAMAAERNNRWYPKFHIASNGGWINDPNGLCFYKIGRASCRERVSSPV